MPEVTKYLQSLGGQIVSQLMDIPDIGRFAVGKDPQGAMFSVMKSVRAGA